MKTYLIEIDGRTIRKNPEYDDYIPGCRNFMLGQIRFEVKFRNVSEAPKYLVNEENCSVIEMTPDSVLYVVVGEKIRKRLARDIDSKKIQPLDINISREVIDVTSAFPPSEYLYKYKDAKITCNECGESFSYRRLRSDEVFYEYEAYSDAICPECWEWDCVELIYEEIEEYVKRMGITMDQLREKLKK